jgi:hypothetical protein
METKNELTIKQQRNEAIENGFFAGVKTLKSVLSFDMKNLSNCENISGVKNHLHHLSKDEGKTLVNFIQKKYKVETEQAIKILYHSTEIVCNMIDILNEVEMNKKNEENEPENKPEKTDENEG